MWVVHRFIDVCHYAIKLYPLQKTEGNILVFNSQLYSRTSWVSWDAKKRKKQTLYWFNLSCLRESPHLSTDKIILQQMSTNRQP